MYFDTGICARQSAHCLQGLRAQRLLFRDGRAVPRRGFEVQVESNEPSSP